MLSCGEEGGLKKKTCIEKKRMRKKERDHRKKEGKKKWDLSSPWRIMRL
jgi:hypothetical protein